jgi:uncharacterized repeat protein (TIGR01451 family)
MKKYYFLWMLLGIPLPLFTQSAWQQTAGPEGCSVISMQRNATTVFAATTNGIWQSSDEGASWSQNNTLMLDQSILGLYVSDNEVLAVGLEPKVNYQSTHHYYRSIDGGLSWNEYNIQDDVKYALSSISLKIWRDGTTIWIVDDYDNCFKSTDSGVTWNEIIIPPTIGIQHIAVNGNNILAFGYYGTVRSEDGGQNWTETSDTSYNYGFHSEGNFIILLGNDTISVSQDFGLTWQTAPTDLYELEGVIRGADGYIYRFYRNIFRSLDGLSWEPVTQGSPSPNIYRGVQSGDAFIVGGNGMYKTVNNNTQFVSAQSGFINTTTSSIAAMKTGRVITSMQGSGTWSSYNKGLSWSKLPNVNAPYTVSFNTMTTQGDTVWGVGSNDTLYRIIGNSNTWEKVTDADGWFAGETFVRVIGDKIYIVEDQQIRRSLDQGVTWQVFLSGNVGGYGYRGIAKVGAYLFYSTNDGIVYRSADDGLSWQSNYEIWSPGAHRLNALTTSGNRLFLWNEYEGYYTIDFGVTWQVLNMNGLPIDMWGDPYFDPIDIVHFGNTILCTIPFRGVWISFDLGNNWQPLNDGLTNKRGRKLAISGNDIYLGSSTSGVWRLGANFEVFSGGIYNDKNANGQKDAGEGPLNNLLVVAEPLGSYTTSDNAGIYSLVAAAQLDTIRVQPPNDYCTVSPAFHLAAQTSSAYDFGIHFTEGIVDLKIDMTNWEPFRPGFDNKLTLTVQNVGNETVQNAQVICVLPNTLNVDFIIPFGITTVSNDTIFWNIPALSPFESTSIQIEVTLSANEPIGNILSLLAHVEADGDISPLNNNILLRETIVGSYDPNDKYAVSGITPEQVVAGKPIEYIIRFENTGTFYAEKVVITDWLDDNLNPATFHFISASHPCEWRITTEGKLEFTFDEIFLNVSETGYIKFSIEADRDLLLNEFVQNTAEIYFDFNAPIITNTVKTTVQVAVPTTAINQPKIDLEISPNPAKDVIWVTVLGLTAQQGGFWEIMDESAKTLLRDRQSSDNTHFSVASFPNGTYDVVLRKKDGTAIAAKKVVVAH